MATHTFRFKQTLMAVVIMAGSLFAHGQETAAPLARQEVKQNTLQTLATDATLQQWFQEQDSILEGILLRMAHIEALVRDIHRLITSLPDPVSPAAAATPIAVVAAPPAPRPVVTPLPPATAEAPKSGNIDLLGWLPYAGVAGLLGLLVFMAKRRRQTTPQRHSLNGSSQLAALAPNTHAGPQAKSAADKADDSIQADQALELADIMLSMGLGHGAAQTLIDQIKQQPKQGLRHWLKLLEIYRKNDQHDEFERAAEELRQHFNVHPEYWNATPTQTTLEDYPHIAARIIETWPGCLPYLQSLLNDNRGGARSGFPQTVAEELLLLSALLKAR